MTIIATAYVINTGKNIYLSGILYSGGYNNPVKIGSILVQKKTITMLKITGCKNKTSQVYSVFYNQTRFAG